jgi:hypothetical protein
VRPLEKERQQRRAALDRIECAHQRLQLAAEVTDALECDRGVGNREQ